MARTTGNSQWGGGAGYIPRSVAKSLTSTNAWARSEFWELVPRDIFHFSFHSTRTDFQTSLTTLSLPSLVFLIFTHFYSHRSSVVFSSAAFQTPKPANIYTERAVLRLQNIMLAGQVPTRDPRPPVQLQGSARCATLGKIASNRSDLRWGEGSTKSLKLFLINLYILFLRQPNLCVFLLDPVL